MPFHFQIMFKKNKRLRLSIAITMSSVLLLIFSCKKQTEEQIKHKYTNDLINETSPYLLQHAHNPVNWRPWSQHALDEAKKENKLVLTSIGYSSCHWCHVMEEETFANEDVAKLMNENFINIKIDREERPDIDQVYMTALQLMKGSGGWPLNIIALPSGKPLYGGTYHTKEEWNRVLSKISALYHQDPEIAVEYANNVAEGIQEANLITSSEKVGDLTRADLKESIANWKLKWDSKWGGDNGSEKFMLPVNLEFLMEYSFLSKDTFARDHLIKTLDNIALKGVYDHVEGGFFRYSTDEKWQLPHFEKMLYDNAQLITLYSKAYKIFKDPLYEQVVKETIEFLNNRMKNPDGGYYASLDAGSKGDEGDYYLWQRKELESTIENNYPLFQSYFNIKEANKLDGDNFHLFKKSKDSVFQVQHRISEGKIAQYKKEWVQSLQKARQKRNLPNIDDKIITSWNSLLINGLLEAYTAFGNESYLESAISIFETLVSKAYSDEKLVHSFKPKSKRIDGFLEDYVFLEQASLKLYSITMDKKYLVFAKKLNNAVKAQFSDDENVIFTYSNNEKLISKIFVINDGVQPSANAVMAENLFILGHLDYNKKSFEKSRDMLSAIGPFMKDSPSNYSKWNSLLLKLIYPYYEIAVVGKDAENLLLGLHKEYIPNTLIVGTTSSSNYPLFEQRFIEDETYIYVCEEKTCKRPVKTVNEAIRQLQNF